MCEHFRFHPRAAFKRIDRLNNLSLSALDLSSFLKDNGYNCYSVDFVDMLCQYDLDSDTLLSLPEFMTLVITNSDHVLAKRCQDRYEEYVGFHDKLPADLEQLLARVLIEEMIGLKMLRREKDRLKARNDFSRLDAFRAIDTHKMNCLLRDDLKYFLNRNGICASALEVEHLFFRLDKDRDGRITYTEFCDHLEKLNFTKPI